LIQQNEYTTAIEYDRHTLAYQVLLGEKAATIARNLAPTNGGVEIPAHLDQRCLACHVTPEASALTKQGGKPDLAVANWRLAGVSCEACHGPASKPDHPWLAKHTAPAEWRLKFEKAPQDPAWKQYGFTDLGELRTQAQVCAGCHVGSPPVVRDGKTIIPARDCNHDIMAAGHPRLNFELVSFRNNMPPHWNVAKKGQNTNEYEAKVWSHGQFASAEAALKLLAYRAREAERAEKQPEAIVRWPEFAEYRCYACHSDLNTGWRKADPHPNRKVGSLPYDNWYHEMLSALETGLRDDYAALTALMAQPTVSAADVAAKAEALAKKLEMRKAPEDPRVILAWVKNGFTQLPRTWEGATQLTLCVAAMKRVELSRNDPALAPLRMLADELAFPQTRYGAAWGPRGIDGPVSGRRGTDTAFKELMKGLR
jgi:hypothetical protein